MECCEIIRRAWMAARFCKGQGCNTMTHGQTDMNEYEALDIYDNEIAPLEQMVDTLEDENRCLRIDRDNLRRSLISICTELDYLLAAIQDDMPNIVEEPDTEVYSPRLNKVWIDAFFQELPIIQYSKETKT